MLLNVTDFYGDLFLTPSKKKIKDVFLCNPVLHHRLSPGMLTRSYIQHYGKRWECWETSVGPHNGLRVMPGGVRHQVHIETEHGD